MELKIIFMKIDQKFFGGFFLKKVYRPLIAKKSLHFDKLRLSSSITFQYKKNDNSILNSLCDKYGSDKGETKPTNNPYPWNSHNYADFYALAFGLRRSDVQLVIECGLGTNNPNLVSTMGVDGQPGASLRVWRDFFPKAQIIGCDIDSQILFKEERIITFHCDQTSPESILKFCDSAKILEKSVDVIIDDGLHEYLAGCCFFEKLISKLRTDGIYIIEDVSHSDMIKYKKYFSKLEHLYETRFVYLSSPIRLYGDNNNLISITKKI